MAWGGRKTITKSLMLAIKSLETLDDYRMSTVDSHPRLPAKNPFSSASASPAPIPS